MDTQKRTFAKTFSWRFFATFITGFVVYFATGELKLGLGVGLLDTFIKFFAYYFHERFWNKLNFGRAIQSEANGSGI